MTRRSWNDIALALAHLHAQLLEHAKNSRTQRGTHIARADGVMLAARAVCRTLRERSTRFDGRRFMRIITTGGAAK